MPTWWPPASWPAAWTFTTSVCWPARPPAVPKTRRPTGSSIPPLSCGRMPTAGSGEERIIPYWKKAAAVADDYGVKLCIEPHTGDCVYNTQTFLRLRREVGPTIGMNLDPLPSVVAGHRSHCLCRDHRRGHLHLPREGRRTGPAVGRTRRPGFQAPTTTSGISGPGAIALWAMAMTSTSGGVSSSACAVPATTAPSASSARSPTSPSTTRWPRPWSS